jgi:uncharacterized membrane protein
VNALQKSTTNPFRLAVLLVAGLFFAVCSWVSWNRWANFEYRTFDLAFYVQALWQLVHGRFSVSLLNVPLLGEHAHPVVFLIAPLFALAPHPMLLPVIQIAALASMAPVGWRICLRLGLGRTASALMASALLITPATGFVALHEFHPEAFAAPFILLMIEARLRDSLRWHWVWFLATLACKENMPLLLAAYCLVEAATDRRHRMLAWNILPGIIALGWFLFYLKILSPWLNSGNIEFATLYNRLGNSAGDIVLKFFTEPGRAWNALANALVGGNLLWGLLLPFLGLPLLRPRWLLVAAPLLLQHLLSWRASEWTIYFHYAAPLIPLFWIASAEAVRKWPAWVPGLVVAACLAGQCLTGPARDMQLREQDGNHWKLAMIESIPPQAGVVAPMPYLSHLATRERLYSLHHILKGLKTLSHAAYAPPESIDAVVIDYDDTATFDAGSGYYHPKMRTTDGRIIASSDRLLHEFLRRGSWTTESVNGVTVYHHHDAVQSPEPPPGAGTDLDDHTRLLAAEISGDKISPGDPLRIRMVWSFSGERGVIPWMILRFKSGDEIRTVTKGLCAPEAGDDGRCHEEIWHVFPPPDLAAGPWTLEAVFLDNSRRAWARQFNSPATEKDFVLKVVPLGTLTVLPK